MRPFDHAFPTTLAEASRLLAGAGDQARALAGGTDLVPRMRRGDWRPSLVVNLKRIPGLRGIEHRGGELWIGALSTLAQVARSPLVLSLAPVLARAAARVASLQVRNLATIGGNIANASPAADMAPPLLVLGAEVGVAGPADERRTPLDGFFAGPGRTKLAAGEILTGFAVPVLSDLRASYVKFERREAMDIAVAGVAAAVRLLPGKEGSPPACGEARIALGAVAPTPMRALEAEEILAGQELSPERIARAARAAAGESRPIDDVRGPAWYRRHLVEVLSRRVLAGLASGNLVSGDPA
ncbi:MAG: xanthine dehydrogenase family protein subunit M [Planctomycetes bacterium]|nr:xanthine dehydrogenase family protein subunit M [Planctomycetota bacterium]